MNDGKEEKGKEKKEEIKKENEKNQVENVKNKDGNGDSKEDDDADEWLRKVEEEIGRKLEMEDGEEGKEEEELVLRLSRKS